MKFILSAALVAVLAMPLAAGAQQAQYPATPQTEAPATQGQGQQVPRLYRRWSKLLEGLNLSSQQHDQIQTILDQFAQAHPPGSQRDPSAVRMLREQVMGVLNAQQQTQLRDNMRAMELRAAQMRVQQLQREMQQSGGSYPAPVTTTNP